MILVTRLNGLEFALNPDLVERADSTPDTVVTLVDGTKYVIAESVEEFIRLVRLYRAGVLADAQRLTEEGPTVPEVQAEHDHGHERNQDHNHGANVLTMYPRER